MTSESTHRETSTPSVSDSSETAGYLCCSKCKRYKQPEDFHRNKHRASGRTERCKSCVSDYQVAYRESHREHYRKQGRDRYKDKRDEILAKNKLYHIKNRDVRNQKCRERRERNHAAYLESARRYSKENREKINQAQNARYHANPSIMIAAVAARRAKKYEAAIRGDVTAADIKRVFEEFGHCCAYCGSSENVQLEHVIPLKRGGKHSLDNLVLACKPCNISKNAKLLLEVACKPALLIYKRAHTNV